MNHEHYISTQWRASLGFFTCEQLTLFGKLTLNAYFITLKTLITYFGWIFVVWFGLIQWSGFIEGFNAVVSKLNPATVVAIGHIPTNIFCAFAVFFIVCAARSSVTRKHWYYFIVKTARFYIPFSLVAMLIFSLGNYCINVLHADCFLRTVIGMHLGLYLILFCFFYIDMRSVVKALWNALRMMVYTYPVMIVMGLIAFALYCLCSFLVAFFSVVLSNIALLHLISALIFWLFGSALLIVMMSNIYIKHVYEYNKIYCPVP